VIRADITDVFDDTSPVSSFRHTAEK